MRRWYIAVSRFVTRHGLVGPFAKLSPDFTSSRLHDTGGDRRPISQCLRHQAAGRRSIHETGGRAVRGRRVYSVCLKGNTAISMLLNPHAYYLASMAILSSINWTSTTQSTTGFSARAATTTKATMSKTSHRSAVTSVTPSSLTIAPPPIFSTHNTPFPLAAGSATHTTTNCSTSSLSSKTWLVTRCRMSVLFSTLAYSDTHHFGFLALHTQRSISLA